MVSNDKHGFVGKKYYISILAVFQITEFDILKKQLGKNKKHFLTCTFIKHIFFPEGSTKNIKSSTSNKDISTASGAQEETQPVKKSKGIIMGKLEK